MEASRNRALLAKEGLVAAIVANLATAFVSMFAARMGASDYQIGLVSSLPPAFGLAVLLPGALATDRMGDKRRMVVGSILVLAAAYFLVSLTPFLGDTRVWAMILLISFSNAPASLYTTSWQAWFSDIVKPELRNSFYAARTKATFLVGVIVVLLTGLVLAYAPRDDADRIHLYQLFYFLAFLVSFVQIQLLRKVKGGEAPAPAKPSGLRLSASLAALFRSPAFLGFAGLSLFFYVSWQMAWPLFFITQVRYLGADEAWLSWLAVSTSILCLLSTGFWSRFIDRHGVRATLVVGILGIATSPAALAFSTYLPAGIALPALFALNIIAGLTISAFQLAQLQCLLEVVGEQDKTFRIAIFTSLTLVSNIASPLLGVWIYQSLGADRSALTLTLFASSFLRFLAAGAFALRWHRLRGTPDAGRMPMESSPVPAQREEDPVP